MKRFDVEEFKNLYVPKPQSHKGQNGKLLVVGGSSLFHAASLWSLNIASRIVDMVFYSSVKENNEIVAEMKREFRNGIVVPRGDLENYLREADCVVLGPGMVRSESRIKNKESRIKNLREIDEIGDEGEQTYWLTKFLLGKYPEKKWVIDAGALQMMEPEWLLGIKGGVVITPHVGEFETVRSKVKNISYDKTSESKQGLEIKDMKPKDAVGFFAKEYGCIVLLKGNQDVVCKPSECVVISGGNAGMTKGGTGDVLAGLIGALACKNDLWLAVKAGSCFNKLAGDRLFEKVGYYFNASDLVDEIPRVMRKYIE